MQRAMQATYVALRASRATCNASKLSPMITTSTIPCLKPIAKRIQSRREFHSSKAVLHGEITPPKPGEGINVHFITKDGEKISIEANEGDSILDLAHEHDIDLEGACEGSIACSTCHVILPDEFYDMLEEPTDEENDMLDLAFGLTDTSRLGCQVIMRKDLDGITVTLPKATRNMYVDGAKPAHH